MTEKLTIQDIARLAGVSKATVSRVLNQKPDVDPATRERIMRIMEEQSFVPSITASGLANGRSRLIGALIPSLTWPLIPEIMRSVAEVVGLTSYELVLYSINDINHEKDRSAVITRILSTNLTSGLLAIYPGHSSQYLTKLHRQGFPVVLVDDQILPPEGLPWIGSDNYGGGYEATRYLIDLGHRRIGHIQGPLKHQCSHDRYQGYCDALREAGIERDPALVLQGDFMPPSGRACAHTLLSLADPPTAIFASNDYMAYGIMAAAEEHGLSIPDELSVIGFDDTYPSALMQPPLTTIRQPFFDMGKRAIELMLSLLEAPTPTRGGGGRNALAANAASGMLSQDEPVRIQLPTSLIVRASCSASRRVTI